MAYKCWIMTDLSCIAVVARTLKTASEDLTI
jgi:hypothetical protein